MRWIEVERSAPLCGTIHIPGSKNSIQALISAACLADGIVTLNHVPALKDLSVILQICGEIGVKVVQKDGTLVIDPRAIQDAEIDPEKSSTYRAAYYFVGALLARCGRVSVGYPGGDNFGIRPMDQHFKGLKALGADIIFHDDHYVVQAECLKGADICFDTVTMGGTINLMLAATRAKGVTVLRNAARDPEVVDTANLLNRMGARIRGAGTSVVTIQGRTELGECEHMTIPDRLIAGTFLIAGAATKGHVTVTGIIPEHLTACVAKLQEIGLQVMVGDESITCNYEGPLRATRIRTSVYPGVPTDLQQPLTALLLQASGRSIVVDTIYHRFSHVSQLRRMGADIIQRRNGVIVAGGTPLHGKWVHATDVRAGACLILAGLSSEGLTRITGVEHIERGYEDVVATFQSLGGRIKLCDDDMSNTAAHASEST